MLCYGLLFVLWCDAPQPVTLDSFCQIARPVYWSPADTRATKEQVDRHNRIWKAMCRENK